MDQFISARTYNKKKRTCRSVDFIVPVDLRGKIMKQNDRHILGPYQKTKKAFENGGDGDTSSRWYT